MRSYGLRRTLQSELSWRKRQSKIYRSNQQQTQTRSPHLSSSFAVKEAAAAADDGATAVCGGAQEARAANYVKKPPLIVNNTYLELNGFNASMWVS